MHGEQTAAGDFGDRKWRHATDGGWFSWQLKVLPDQPQELWVTYWGSDGGNRIFDILVDGQKIATQRLENNKPDKFYDEVYRLPADLLQRQADHHGQVPGASRRLGRRRVRRAGDEDRGGEVKVRGPKSEGRDPKAGADDETSAAIRAAALVRGSRVVLSSPSPPLPPLLRARLSRSLTHRRAASSPNASTTRAFLSRLRPTSWTRPCSPRATGSP